MRGNLKNILILGASSDIGAELINQINKREYTIFAHYSKNLKKNKVTNERNLKLIKADFEKINNKNYKSLILKKFNHNYDCIVNLVGFIDNKSYENTTLEDIFCSLKINSIFPMLIIRNSIKKMLKKKYGRILNCSSIGVKFGGGQKSFNYSFSKHCLEFIPHSYKAWSKKNVLINNLRIGLTNTKIHKKNSKNKFLSKRINLVPMQRMASTKEIADFIIKVIDEKNSFMTGQTLSISGGE